MKLSSCQSKNCKLHVNAPSHVCRKITSSSLSKEMWQEYSVPSMPVCLHSQGWWNGSRTLERSTNRQGGSGVQNEIRHPHWAGTVGKGQQHDYPCGHSPQRGGFPRPNWTEAEKRFLHTKPSLGKLEKRKANTTKSPWKNAGVNVTRPAVVVYLDLSILPCASLELFNMSVECFLAFLFCCWCLAL